MQSNGCGDSEKYYFPSYIIKLNINCVQWFLAINNKYNQIRIMTIRKKNEAHLFLSEKTQFKIIMFEFSKS